MFGLEKVFIKYKLFLHGKTAKVGQMHQEQNFSYNYMIIINIQTYVSKSSGFESSKGPSIAIPALLTRRWISPRQSIFFTAAAISHRSKQTV